MGLWSAPPGGARGRRDQAPTSSTRHQSLRGGARPDRVRHRHGGHRCFSLREGEPKVRLGHPPVTGSHRADRPPETSMLPGPHIHRTAGPGGGEVGTGDPTQPDSPNFQAPESQGPRGQVDGQDPPSPRVGQLGHPEARLEKKAQ